MIFDDLGEYIAVNLGFVRFVRRKRIINAHYVVITVTIADTSYRLLQRCHERQCPRRRRRRRRRRI